MSNALHAASRFENDEKDELGQLLDETEVETETVTEASSDSDDVLALDEYDAEKQSPDRERKSRHKIGKRSAAYQSPDTWGYTCVPQHLTHSDEFLALTAYARLLIHEALDRVFFCKNGMLVLSPSTIRGMSSATLYRVRDELITGGFIVVTREPSAKDPSQRFALTFLQIPDDAAKAFRGSWWTDTPPHSWRKTTSAPTKSIPVDGPAVQWAGPSRCTNSQPRKKE
jgi:hypothetical protein